MFKWIADHLPHQVMYWVIIRVWAQLTTTKYRHLTPDRVTWAMALKHLDGTDAKS